MVMGSLTDGQRAAIDALVLSGGIIAGTRCIMLASGVRLAEARELFKARYRQLRAERGGEFACGDREYWSGYAETLEEAIDKGL